MPRILIAALLTIPMGFGAGLAWVTGYTLLQENVSDEFRGRTFGTLTTMVRVGLFVSLLFFPAVQAALAVRGVHVGSYDLSTRLALWIGAAITATGGFSAMRGMRWQRVARPRPLGLAPRVRSFDRSGVFIVFEGVEGSGKGTQIPRAKAFVESRGHHALVCREPGSTSLGERLRETVLDPATGHLDPRAEALLFAAARAQLVTSVIRPALEEGKVVLCDRFVDSSVAYQGVGRGLGEEDVLSLNAWATQGLFPDLVLLLHVDPDVGLERAERGGAVPDRIEQEGTPFLAKVSDAYLHIAEEHPERFVVVDAARPPDDVERDVRMAIAKVVGRAEQGRGGPT
jgi:dTMP kinase